MGFSKESSTPILKKIQAQKFPIISSIFASFVIILANLFSIDTAHLSSSLAFLIVPAILVILSIWRITKTPQKDNQRTSFFIFAAFAIFSFIAEQLWTVYESIYKIDPYPSLADFFWLASYGLLFLFFIMQLRPLRQLISKNIIIFSLAISIGFFIPSLLTTYETNSEISEFELAVTLSYPISETILLAPALIGLLLFFNGKGKIFWGAIVLGVLSNTVSDTFFLYLNTTDSYYTGHPIDTGYLVAYILFSFGIYNTIKLPNNYSKFDSDKTFSGGITSIFKFEDVNKLVIPLVFATIIIVALMSLVNLYYFQDVENTRTHSLSIILWVLTVMTSISIVVMIINHNLAKIVKSRTKELQAERDGLENQVKEKTGAILKAEKMSTIGQLTSRVGHDLRNPLTVIKTTIEIMKMQSKELDAKNLERFVRIEDAIRSMSNQIEDMLNFVRTSKLTLDNYPLSKILDSAVNNIKKPDSIKINKPDNDFIIKCDFNKIQSMLMNFITNSIQAIGDRGEITIRFMDADKEIMIEVEDSGPGIPEEILPKIFEPLFTTKDSGTGLGLASCKNIAEQHGGEIFVRNNPTTFTAKLPKQHKIEPNDNQKVSS